MQTFIAADQFITKREARHQSSLFHPEYGAETTAKENSFDGSKCYQALCKTAVLNPAQCPFCFFLHRRYCFNRMKKTVFFLRVLDIGIYEQGIGLGMDVFHHDLE